MRAAVRPLLPPFLFNSTKIVQTITINCSFLSQVSFRALRRSLRLRSFASAASQTPKVPLDDIASRLSIKSYDQWLHIDPKTIPELAKLKRGQLCSELIQAYPSHDWKPWLFQHDTTPKKFWNEKENRRHFFDWLFQKLGMESMESRYDLTVDKVHQHGGGSLLVRQYRDSVQQALADLYPEHKWLPWLFSRAPAGIWKIPEVRREYMDWLGEQLKISTKGDWYNVTMESFRLHHGAGILSCVYKDSVANAVMDNFPEHDWAPWKFRQVPSGYWDRPGVRQHFFETIAPELGVRKLEDWYSVKREQVRQIGGGALVTKRFYNLPDALKDAYPDHSWDPTKFGPS